MEEHNLNESFTAGIAPWLAFMTASDYSVAEVVSFCTSCLLQKPDAAAFTPRFAVMANLISMGLHDRGVCTAAFWFKPFLETECAIAPRPELPATGTSLEFEGACLFGECGDCTILLGAYARTCNLSFGATRIKQNPTYSTLGT